MDELGRTLRALALLAGMSPYLLFALPSISRGDDRVSSASADAWTKTEIITPAVLAPRLASGLGEKSAIVCVGFDFLYRGGHIPGALYLGPGREPAGIERLKKWAASIP